MLNVQMVDWLISCRVFGNTDILDGCCVELDSVRVLFRYRKTLVFKLFVPKGQDRFSSHTCITASECHLRCHQFFF